MTNHSEIAPKVRYMLTTKNVFTNTLIVVVLTIVAIWLFGLGKHRTIFENSILSTTVLSISFFLFIAIGLFKGVKLKDNIGKLTDQLKLSEMPDFSEVASGADFVEAGDGIGGIIIGIILWIVATIIIALFLWLFGVVVWTGIIVFMAMLYWIFFRALRLVFKNAARCKNNLTLSIGYGLAYTFLYNIWIYGIILIAHYIAE